MTSWPWCWEGEKPGLEGVPQLKREPRQSPGSLSPPHPPSQGQHTWPHCPLLPAWGGQGCKDLNSVSALAEGGTLAPGSLSWLLPSQWKRRDKPKGRGPDMGAGGIRAAFTGSSSPGTVLAVSRWRGKAWAELGGLGPGLATPPIGLMTGKAQSSTKPQC